MALPILLAGLRLAPTAARYFRRAPKNMGKVEIVPPKALPAPKGVATGGTKSSSLGNAAALGAAAVAAASTPDPKPASNANSGGTIDTRNVKPTPAAPAAPKAAPAPKVMRVQTGAKGGTKTSAVSTGTTTLGRAASSEGNAGEAEARTYIKAQNNVQSVQGAGNMDTPKDPTAGVSEEELKRIGLEESNKELAAKGGGGLWQRLKDGNIDQAGSAAYNKYGAGYGREVLRRRAAAKSN